MMGEEQTATTDWQRVRSAIEHENDLTNHRLTWLFSSQGFLFAAFALIFQASISNDATGSYRPNLQVILSVTALLGMLICSVIWVRVSAAKRQHDRNKDWWEKRYEAHLSDHPYICGEEKWPEKIFRFSTLPFIFILAWVSLLATATFDFVKTNAIAFGLGIGIVAITFGLLMLGVMIGIMIERKIIARNKNRSS